MRVHQQTAYILVNRAYSESSWITEIFSKQHGRLSLMAKGARRLKSPLRGVLMPFKPLLLGWTGKGEVPTLTQAEINQADYSIIDQELQGDALICGFYCNELLVKFLHRHDPHAKLFDVYDTTIKALSKPLNSQQHSLILREFEQCLMRESGYAVDFVTEADGATAIGKENAYLFIAGQGFVAQSYHSEKTVTGRVVLSLSEQPPANLSAVERAQARDLMRLILQQNLNHSSIVSRSLFYPRSLARNV